MTKPRFLDQVAAELGDAHAFTSMARGRRPFQPAHVEPQYPRDRAVDIRHIKLEVALDFTAKSISGTATHRIAAIYSGVDRIELDAAEMEIKSVAAAGSPVAFETDAAKLRITLARPLSEGDELELAIEYRATPRRGLYFVGPDTGYPNKPVQAWTQGEDEDSRYWFPCYDYPNARATSEVIAIVPAAMTAVSNGALVSVEHDAARGTRRFHYRHDTPHSNYLISLAAGEFATIEDRAGATPVLYHVTPGREDDARRAFGNTPRMIEFFERAIGVPYPYAKYAQVAVNDFIFGGMENTSATTQTADTMHDERAHLDFKSDPLVAHELAHQWWGDLLTCRDWSHAWLNEGFATYFEALWCEQNLGVDEFAWNLRQDRDGYFDEDSHRYRRPVVCNRYRAPIELFDRHLYEKGSLILHMIRAIVGDEPFFKSLGLYCRRHRGGNVITLDFQRAIEDTTGRNLDYFFDQWVYKEGHPDIEVSSAFDDKRKIASVTVKQTQKTSESIGLFRFPVTIALMDKAGAEVRHRVEVREKEHIFNFPRDKAPRAVRIDPAREIVMSLKHKRSREALEAELKFAVEAIGRGGAARELGREGSPAAVDALGTSLKSDAFWGVRSDVVSALGQIRTEHALDALLDGIRDEHPKVRRAVMRALGQFRGDRRAADALIELLGAGDASYFVEAEAALALGRTRDERAFDRLKEVLARPSYLDTIRAHAFAGMAELRDDRAIELSREWTAYGRPPRARVAAIGTLARFGAIRDSRRVEIIDWLIPLCDDPEFMVRMRIPGAFEEIADSRAVAALRRMAERELDGRIVRRANESAAAIGEARSHADDRERVREDIDKMREDNRKLRERLDKLEAATAPKPAEASPDGDKS
jgi:aminopeptidase N